MSLAPSARAGRPIRRLPYALLATALASVFAAGCGGTTGKAASGTVTWDGTPLDQGMIEFVPTQAGALPAGAVIRDGHYSLPGSSGLAPGTYQVRIHSRPGFDAGPGNAPEIGLGDPNATERLPERYNDATTLSAEVTSGGSNTFDFELSGARPAPARGRRATRGRG